MVVQCLEEFFVRGFSHHSFDISIAANFNFDQPSFSLSADSNLLGLAIKLLIDLNHFPIAWHVNICCCLNTLN